MRAAADISQEMRSRPKSHASTSSTAPTYVEQPSTDRESLEPDWSSISYKDQGRTYGGFIRQDAATSPDPNPPQQRQSGGSIREPDWSSITYNHPGRSLSELKPPSHHVNHHQGERPATEPNWSNVTYKDQAPTFGGFNRSNQDVPRDGPERYREPHLRNQGVERGARHHETEAGAGPPAHVAEAQQEEQPPIATQVEPVEDLTEEKIYQAALKGAKDGATQEGNRMPKCIIPIAIIVVLAIAVGVAVPLATGGGSGNGDVTEVQIFNTVYETEYTTQIFLSGSGLTGPIPTDLSLLTGLKILDLSGNSFTGTLPPELADLPVLASIDVSENQLTGQLPPAYGEMTQLTSLDIHGNEGISGAIPSELENLINLSTLWIYGTQLTGRIPSALCTAGDGTPDIRIDCGEISCDCCASSDRDACVDDVPTPATTTSTSPTPATTTSTSATPPLTDPSPTDSPITVDKDEYTQGQYINVFFDDPGRLNYHDDVLVFPANVSDYINTLPVQSNVFGGGAGTANDGRTKVRVVFPQIGLFKVVVRADASEFVLGTSPPFRVVKSSATLALDKETYIQGQYIRATFSDPGQFDTWDDVLVFPADETDYVNNPSMTGTYFGNGAGVGNHGRVTMRADFLQTGTFKLVVNAEERREFYLAESLPFTVTASTATLTLDANSYKQGDDVIATFSDPSQLHSRDDILVFLADETDYIYASDLKFQEFGSGAGAGNNGVTTVDVDWASAGTFKLIVRVNGRELVLGESDPFVVTSS